MEITIKILKQSEEELEKKIKLFKYYIFEFPPYLKYYKEEKKLKES